VVLIGQASPLTGPQAHLGKDNETGRAWRWMKSTPPG